MESTGVSDQEAKKRVCIVGASGKLGRYMVQHALDRGYEIVAVCREQSVSKLKGFKNHICIIPGQTNDREVIKRAVAGCDGVLTVLVPWGMHSYSSGTAQAVLDYASPGARLIFSCGWHITRDGKDVYSWKFKTLVRVFGFLARLARVVDLDDQVEACRRVFASDTHWTVVPWQRSRRGGKPGPSGVEPTCGRPYPREQSHTTCGLCVFHGQCPRRRRPYSRGSGDCWPSDTFGRRALTRRVTRDRDRRIPGQLRPLSIPLGTKALVYRCRPT